MPQSRPWICRTFPKDRKSGSFEYLSAASMGKARGDDDVRTGPQEFEGCLKTILTRAPVTSA